MIVGVRNTGKSYLTSTILAQAKRDKTFDVIYIVTPSFNSNKAYFGEYILPENVYEPTKDSISLVIKRVEQDRDEFEQYLKEVEEYKLYQKEIKNRPLSSFNPETLMYYLDMGFLDNEKPEWKYGEPAQAPRSLLILDDVIGSPAISHSSGLTKIATLNRHIAPLTENHKDRSACGLAVIILTQTYKMVGGLQRAMRENVSLLTLFQNKQEKQLDSIRDELANVVDIDKFNKSYEYATSEKYGNITIDFSPKSPEYTFRKNLNELIIFDMENVIINK